jgi:hypothetical protein
MRTFIVQLENRPGMLAGLLESVAARGINLTSLGGAASGDRGAFALLAPNESGLREVLDSRGVAYSEASVVSVALDDLPGSVAAAARRVGEAGVNLVAVFPTGMSNGKVVVALGVSDAPAAREALADLADG